MPRKKPRLIVAANRVAEARRIVVEQSDLIARLKASDDPALDAERALQSYLSSLEHLEDYERKIKREGQAKKRETKNRQSRRLP